MTITSDVPLGSGKLTSSRAGAPPPSPILLPRDRPDSVLVSTGLSSSAALEVATATLIEALYSFTHQDKILMV